MPSDRVRGHLRTLLLAAVAAKEPQHGYAVIASLRAASDGVFSLNEGAVYPVLHRLEGDGLISSQWDDSSGRRRRSYSLTERGRQQLRNDADDWRVFRDSIDTILEEVMWL
jgi:DNA-binding PadR family transcriptional regulator